MLPVLCPTVHFSIQLNKYLPGVFCVAGTTPGAKATELISTWFSPLQSFKFSGRSRHILFLKNQLKYRVIIVITYRRGEKYTGRSRWHTSLSPGEAAEGTAWTEQQNGTSGEFQEDPWAWSLVCKHGALEVETRASGGARWQRALKAFLSNST